MAGASMNDIKARIKSVNGTMQITKAMELVATSKLKGAKARAENAKPFLDTLTESINAMLSIAEFRSSVFSREGDGKTLYILIAGDRGLAGGYNSNVIKLASLSDAKKDGIYLPIGKKARDHVLRRSYSSFTSEELDVANVGVGKCMNLGKAISDGFKNGDFSSVKLVYTKFVSMLTQSATVTDILPLKASDTRTSQEPYCEMEADELIEQIVPEYIGGMLYAAVSESVASECAARRTAMNSANKNAEEMIGTLTLKFNRARQAVITQEITEIVSGAEAL